jgi:hypothetical protein
MKIEIGNESVYSSNSKCPPDLTLRVGSCFSEATFRLSLCLSILSYSLFSVPSTTPSSLPFYPSLILSLSSKIHTSRCFWFPREFSLSISSRMRTSWSKGVYQSLKGGGGKNAPSIMTLILFY